MKLRRISSILIFGLSLISLSSCDLFTNSGKTNTNIETTTTNIVNTTDGNVPTNSNNNDNTSPTNNTSSETETYCTVSFVSNCNTNVNSQQVLKGKTASNVTNITKDADSENTYTFAGWYSDSSFNNLFDFNTPINDNLILYAKWNANPITYDFKIISSIDNKELYTTKVNSGKSINEPSLNAITGYTLIDFYTDNTYNEKYNFNNKITGNTTIYAYYVSTASINSNLTILSYNGYAEGAYIEFGKITGLENVSDYKVYYKGPGNSDYVKINDSLIRITNSKIRADIVGLSEDTYSIKVVAGTQTEIRTVEVTKDDRSGYAHFNNTNGVGAYNDDGTLKENAVVVYVTDSNKNSVTATINGTTYTGLVNIIKNANKNYPLDIRVIGDIKTCQFNKIKYTSSPLTTSLLQEQANSLGGNYKGYKAADILSNNWNSYSNDLANGITELENLSSSVSYGGNSHNKDLYTNAFDTAWNMCNVSSKENITIEGIGEDAGIFQWGFSFGSCKNIEVKNLRFHNYTEDAVGIQNGSNFWLHNNTFDIGVNNWDFSDEQDKGDGDGATDFKLASNLTISYCRYNNTHKTNLIGGDNKNLQQNVTLHHNFYNNCSSRLPLGRQANMHFYNNYYYHCNVCQDIRANAFVLSEYNYFDSCSNPQKVSVDSTYTGTVIKSFNDYLANCGSSAATKVTDRTTTLSGNCKPDGSTNYTNFDTNSSLFYYDTTNKCSDVEILTKVEDIPTFVSSRAGAGTLKNLVSESTSSITYTISFNTNGGSTIESQTIKSGKTINYVEPTKSGYIFSGWYTDTKFENAFDSLTKITDNLTLYAKWTEEITISFNSNNGSSVNDIKIAKGGSLDTLPTSTKDNYKFDGWYLDSEFNTKVTTSTTFSSSQTLYAKWTEKTNNTVLTFNDFETGEFTSNISKNEITLTVKTGTDSRTSEIKSCNTTIDGTSITKYVAFGGAGNYSQISIQFTITSTSNITVYYAGGSGRYAALYDENGQVSKSTTATTKTGSSNAVSYTFENIEAGNYAITSAGSSMEFYVIIIS
ncbi:MAG: InlB B-repeat-containing protein [Acholeplasmatales bacterium]|nr:InlB B-repeat-containing protein [Acholeplasmatales bacterium]